MVELERRDVPTVLFTAQTFIHDAERSAASFGLPGLPLAVVPLPFTNQTPDDVHRMAGGGVGQGGGGGGQGGGGPGRRAPGARGAARLRRRRSPRRLGAPAGRLPQARLGGRLPAGGADRAGGGGDAARGEARAPRPGRGPRARLR